MGSAEEVKGVADVGLIFGDTDGCQIMGQLLHVDPFGAVQEGSHLLCEPGQVQVFQLVAHGGIVGEPQVLSCAVHGLEAFGALVIAFGGHCPLPRIELVAALHDGLIRDTGLYGLVGYLLAVPFHRGFQDKVGDSLCQILDLLLKVAHGGQLGQVSPLFVLPLSQQGLYCVLGKEVGVALVDGRNLQLLLEASQGLIVFADHLLPKGLRPLFELADVHGHLLSPPSCHSSIRDIRDKKLFGSEFRA